MKTISPFILNYKNVYFPSYRKLLWQLMEVTLGKKSVSRKTSMFGIHSVSFPLSSSLFPSKLTYCNLRKWGDIEKVYKIEKRFLENVYSVHYHGSRLLKLELAQTIISSGLLAWKRTGNIAELYLHPIMVRWSRRMLCFEVLKTSLKKTASMFFFC